MLQTIVMILVAVFWWAMACPSKAADLNEHWPAYASSRYQYPHLPPMVVEQPPAMIEEEPHCRTHTHIEHDEVLGDDGTEDTECDD